MTDQTPPRGDAEGLTPDVRALLHTATAESAATRAERRAAAREHAEAVWLERQRRHARYDRLADRSIAALILACWVAAGLFYTFM